MKKNRKFYIGLAIGIFVGWILADFVFRYLYNLIFK